LSVREDVVRGEGSVRSKTCPSKQRQLNAVPTAPILAYGSKTAFTPSISTTAASGCFRSRKQSGTLYESICSQNTPRKNERKASNISMKKYHHNPGFGVRSGSWSGVK